MDAAQVIVFMIGALLTAKLALLIFSPEMKHWLGAWLIAQGDAQKAARAAHSSTFSRLKEQYFPEASGKRSHVVMFKDGTND